MKHILFAIFFILFVKGVNGIEVDRFVHYNTDHGLSQSHVTSIHCDHKGFLWVGTWNGLNKFDGYNFKVYQSNKNLKTIYQIIEL